MVQVQSILNQSGCLGAQNLQKIHGNNSTKAEIRKTRGFPVIITNHLHASLHLWLSYPSNLCHKAQSPKWQRKVNTEKQSSSRERMADAEYQSTSAIQKAVAFHLWSESQPDKAEGWPS